MHPTGAPGSGEPRPLDDLRWWVETDRKLALRVLDLVDAVLRDPFVGIGTPELLRSWEPMRGHGEALRNIGSSTA